MRIIINALIFILAKWDLSMDEFLPIGKVLWWIPMFLNNVITQIFLFAMFPFVCAYLYLMEKIAPYILIYNIFLLSMSLK